MSKLAWGVLAFALMGIGLFLVAVAGVEEVGAALAIVGLFALFPAGIGGFGAGVGD
jgi:hypothetical protein